MVRGGPRRRKPTLPRDDRGLSDFVGTLLMVAVVVALGSVVAVLVTSTLDEPAPERVALSLAPVAPGDAALRILHRNGGPIPVGALVVTLERNESGPVEVPSSFFSAPDPEEWRPGERLSFPLSPAVGADERLRVRVYRSDENGLVAELAARASAPAREPSRVTLNGTFAPFTLLADGVSTTLLAVDVTHPEGALGVASVVADLSPVARAAGSAPLLVALGDSGRDGDAVGGDGIWSALVAVPRSTPAGVWNVTLNATDTQGRVANATARFGTVTVIAGTDGVTTHIGTSFEAPTAENVTAFRLRGWNWDRLHPVRVDDDYVLVRILGDDARSWSALVLLEEAGGVPTAKQLRVWGPTSETVYVPRNGTRIPLEGFDMDLLDPVASLQWVHSSGAPHPAALYPQSGVQGGSRFIAAHFGQDQTTSNQQLSLNTGIFSVDVVLR